MKDLNQQIQGAQKILWRINTKKNITHIENVIISKLLKTRGERKSLESSLWEKRTYYLKDNKIE